MFQLLYPTSSYKLCISNLLLQTNNSIIWWLKITLYYFSWFCSLAGSTGFCGSTHVDVCILRTDWGLPPLLHSRGSISRGKATHGSTCAYAHCLCHRCWYPIAQSKSYVQSLWESTTSLWWLENVTHWRWLVSTVPQWDRCFFYVVI